MRSLQAALFYFVFPERREASHVAAAQLIIAGLVDCGTIGLKVQYPELRERPGT
jgi:hypothetical protein